MLIKLFIYCHWLWLWSFLFLFNIIKYSPLISLFIAFLFTISNNFFNPSLKYLNFNLKIIIALFEFLLLIIVYLKKNYITFNDILVNIFLFIIYLLVLKYNNTSFHEIYFVLLPQKAKKHRTLKSYLKDSMKSEL